MDRVIFINDKNLPYRHKYVINREYEGFRIYDEMTPVGYKKSHSYLITNGEIKVIIDSFMGMCRAEVLDMIDNYNKNGKFGRKAIRWDSNEFILHTNGKVDI